MSLLEALGFLVNYPQVSPRTSSEADLPGLHNRFSNEGAEPPAGKMEVIVKEAKAILELQKISARSLAQLIRKMSAALLAIQPAPLHYRNLQNLKHIALKKKGYDGKIGLSLSARKDLEWWVHNLSVERPSNPGTRPNSGNRDRCLEERLGRVFSGDNDRWMLECSGSTTPHKLPRNDGSLFLPSKPLPRSASKSQFYCSQTIFQW